MQGEELIVKNGSITLRSMLDFGGFLEIKRFLEACHSENCTVTFANEEIVISQMIMTLPKMLSFLFTAHWQKDTVLLKSIFVTS